MTDPASPVRSPAVWSSGPRRSPPAAARSSTATQWGDYDGLLLLGVLKGQGVLALRLDDDGALQRAVPAARARGHLRPDPHRPAGHGRRPLRHHRQRRRRRPAAAGHARGMIRREVRSPGRRYHSPRADRIAVHGERSGGPAGGLVAADQEEAAAGVLLGAHRTHRRERGRRRAPLQSLLLLDLTGILSSAPDFHETGNGFEQDLATYYVGFFERQHDIAWNIAIRGTVGPLASHRDDRARPGARPGARAAAGRGSRSGRRSSRSGRCSASSRDLVYLSQLGVWRYTGFGPTRRRTSSPPGGSSDALSEPRRLPRTRGHRDHRGRAGRHRCPAEPAGSGSWRSSSPRTPP